jgi:hypothetical protein
LIVGCCGPAGLTLAAQGEFPGPAIGHLKTEGHFALLPQPVEAISRRVTPGIRYRT